MFYLPTKTLCSVVVAATITIATPSLSSAQSSGTNQNTSAEIKSDWRKKIGTFRVGIVGGSKAVIKTKQAQPFRLALEEALGMPVEIFAAQDYASLADAHAQSRVEYAIYSATAFSSAWVKCKCIEPIAVPRAADGTYAFRSVLAVRSKKYASLSSLKGQPIAVPGKTSFSGHIFPKRELIDQGYDLDDADWNLSFHKTSKQALRDFVSGEAQALFSWMPHSYDQADTGQNEAYRGLYRNLDSKLHDATRIVWQSDPVPHGPHAIRTNLPQQAKQIIAWFLDGLFLKSPRAYSAIEMSLQGGFTPVTLKLYQPLIDAIEKPIIAVDPSTAPSSEVSKRAAFKLVESKKKGPTIR